MSNLMNIKFYKATKEDIPYIRERLKKDLLDSTNIDWGQFFVARMDGKTVAFGRIIDHGDFFEIASLGVDYYHRKKGIGKKMVTYLAQEAKRRDVQKPIYGVSHLEKFLIACSFVKPKDKYPDYFDYKRRHICRLDESCFKIMKWSK